jgi:predicted N-acetyltransferase YhbS
MVVIERERPGHVRAREALLDRCFGRARRFKTAERLRRGRRPADGLAFAAVEDGVLVGTVRLWEVEAGSAGPALLLGPIAVAPERQGEGIGTALMRHALASAMERGHRAVVLVGDAPYYQRFGFRPEPTLGLELPGPVDRRRFLALELVPGALRGAAGPVVATGRPVATALAA